MINIFILNWNSVNDVSNLLQSIFESDYKLYRVLLIHNASSDLVGLSTIYKKYQKKIEIRLIINNNNLGYAGGNNKAFEYLKTNALNGDILILNPDINLEKNTLSSLVLAKEKTGAGATMIRTYDEHRTHLYDSVKLCGFKQTYEFTHEKTCSSDYAAGSCLFLDRSTIDNIGLFDERFFMYWEEVDLSIRIKEYGKKIISITDSSITRNSNPSERSANAMYYSIRNAFYIYKKHNFKFSSLIFYLSKSFLYSLKVLIKKRDIRVLKSFLLGGVNGSKIYFS